MIRKEWLIALMIVVSNFLGAQDPHFSQYYASSLYLNPALAGVEETAYIAANYRTQWNALGTPFRTTQASFIMPLKMKGSEQFQVGAAGISFFNDKAGDKGFLSTTGVNMTLAYNLRLNWNNNQLISFALQGGWVQRSLSMEHLEWGSQYNDLIGYDQSRTVQFSTLNDQRSFPVFNAGAMYYFNQDKRYYLHGISGFVGIASSYLNKPNESFIEGQQSELPILWKALGGIEIALRPKIHISPNVLYMTQFDNHQINIGAYFTFKLGLNSENTDSHITAGSWYRIGDAFIVSLGGQFKEITISGSYDMNTSSLRQDAVIATSTEISLAYRLSHMHKLKKYSTPLM